MEQKLKAVLYMPDGNQRFSKEKQISLEDAYYQGGGTLKLLTKFFVCNQKAEVFIYHALSFYTHKRTNQSLTSIYKAATKILEELFKEKFFLKNQIKFKAIDHSRKLPPDLVKIANKLELETVNCKKGEVIVLLGYSIEKDYNQAFSQSPDNYKTLRNSLLFPHNIDLVIRPFEMRPSGGPTYAMTQSQMIVVNKLNPEVTEKDLEDIWKKYCELRSYRMSNNPYHQ